MRSKKSKWKFWPFFTWWPFWRKFSLQKKYLRNEKKTKSQIFFKLFKTSLRSNPACVDPLVMLFWWWVRGIFDYSKVSRPRFWLSWEKLSGKRSRSVFVHQEYNRKQMAFALFWLLFEKIDFNFFCKSDYFFFSISTKFFTKNKSPKLMLKKTRGRCITVWKTLIRPSWSIWKKFEK